MEAFRELFDALPADTGMAFVLVMHLSPEYKSQLAEILSKNTTMPVIEASNNLRIKPNHVYIIPPNAGISISDGSLKLEPINRINGPPLPIDKLLKSLAEHRKETAIGILLSGTGSDGTKGLQEIKAKGGYTFAQKPETANFPEMPRNAIESGIVDYVQTIEEIAVTLTEVGKNVGAQNLQGIDNVETVDNASMSRIMSALRVKTGVDFTHYKKATVGRRIKRRMILKNTENINKYAELIDEDPAEADELYNELLINVTSFFRDPEVYSALREEVWPRLLKENPTSKTLRIWVPGCSSGEEVYSIAISLLEYLGDHVSDFVLFGTDIDEQAIKKARQASYPDEIRDQVSPERLSRFFDRGNGQGYQIRKNIRDKCIFAKLNVLTDPPFVNMDLVSCRHLMIYLDSHLQDRVIPTFHYALNRDGFLMLGKSETLGKYDDLFNPVDRSNRIYSKKPADIGKIYPSLIFQPTEPMKARIEPKPSRSDYGELLGSLHKEIERIIESSYAPAGVVVGDDLEVIEFRGDTGAFLEHSSGAASLNLIKMAKGNLSFELRLALDKARQTKQSIRLDDISITGKDESHEVDLEVVPVTVPKHEGLFYLVIFKPSSLKATEEPRGHNKGRPKNRGQPELAQLRRELTDNKVQMQSYMEEQEGVKEELRSANEELRASYEELQSLNEELQSSREEIQSSNEELRTVNDELADKNRDVSSLYSDLNNFVNSTKIGIIMVDNNLKIRRVTPMIERVMNVLTSDVGRSISDFKLSIDVPNLESLIRESLRGLKAIRVDVRSSVGTWYSMRIDLYRALDNRIDGAVIAFIDVNELLQVQRELGKYSVELERQVQKNSGEVMKVNERLREAEKTEAIGKLTALLAHDLRNPLNLISQASEAALTDPEKAGKMLQLIKVNAERSLGMIEELRDSTREINLTKIETDLTQLIRKLIEETTVPEGIKLELRVDEHLRANFDPSLIRRVLENLVSNAVEAMPKGGVLTIRAEGKGEALIVEVEDTGKGIPKESISQVFNSFYTTKAKGLGLGLAFSKRAVEAHGGSIAFRTVLGSGTTFTLTIPQQK